MAKNLVRASLAAIFVVSSAGPGAAAPSGGGAADVQAAGTGVITGRLTARNDLGVAVVYVFPSNAKSDAYVRILRQSHMPQTNSGSISSMMDDVHRVEQDQWLGISALRTMRALPVKADGTFACAGLAPGHYLLVATVFQRNPADPYPAAHPVYYYSLAALPRERKGVRYIAPASAFRSLDDWSPTNS